MVGESTTLVKCGSCRTKVVVQRPNGEIVVLNRALTIRADGAYAGCPQCKAPVLIERLRFEPELIVQAPPVSTASPVINV